MFVLGTTISILCNSVTIVLKYINKSILPSEILYNYMKRFPRHNNFR